MTTTISAPTPARPTIKSHLHPTPSWNTADHALPTGREETWRFTPVKRFIPLMRASAAEHARWQLTLPEQVSAKTVTLDEAKAFSFDPPIDLVTAMAAAGSGDDVTLVSVPPEAEIDEPVVIDLEAHGADVAGHLLVDVGHHAKATILLRHTGQARFAGKIEIHTGEGSHVDFVSVQDWSEGSVHGGQISTLIGRDAQVRTIQASIGKGDVRLNERAEFSGIGGNLVQLGLYFSQAGQHVEHRLFVDHNAPHTESHVDYRGALQGKGAHSVWIGDVLIRANALDIETYETNKNLMLTEGCQADSVPNLEIETGEIRGAGHASSTGRFDEEQLFYLRSRGIPEADARRLVVEGFFLDIIRRIGIPDVEERLAAALSVQLSAIEGMSSTSVLAKAEAE
ncbi:Fe-S cluster assembly protein SufD [Brooklawnia sp.]|uniref:Fe-S cluster assembly protein SufD n=1 Tax=Brooklawnia sp. TaxID=2699740 RepID=UPI00311E2DA3